MAVLWQLLCILTSHYVGTNDTNPDSSYLGLLNPADYKVPVTCLHPA